MRVAAPFAFWFDRLTNRGSTLLPAAAPAEVVGG